MQALEFFYTNAAGETKRRVLENWTEEGHYLVGNDALSNGAPRTFRKDRVTEYLNGCDSLLDTPFVGPPPKIEREPREKSGAAPDKSQLDILFTGFAAKTRADLEAASAAAGLKVVKTVTQQLTFLCIGPNAGPAKVAKARIAGSYIVTEHELPELLESGVLPDAICD